jgi:hypothetical protein
MNRLFTVEEFFDDVSEFEGVLARPKNGMGSMEFTRLYSECHEKKLSGENTVDDLRARVDEHIFKFSVPGGTIVDWTKEFNVYEMQLGPEPGMCKLIPMLQTDDRHEASQAFQTEGKDLAILSTASGDVMYFQKKLH